MALKRRNPRLQWLLFEDGATTYSQQVGGLVQSTSPKVRVQLHQVQKLQGMYLFHPETLDWKPGCPVHKLPQAYAPATLELLNRLFRYDKLGDRYDFPVVFFEESYPCDGVDIGDVALLDRVAKRVGKENVLVKIHPRNQVNRFALAGYRTNQDTSVPWELVALNHSFAGTGVFDGGLLGGHQPLVRAGHPRQGGVFVGTGGGALQAAVGRAGADKAFMPGKPGAFLLPQDLGGMRKASFPAGG